MWLIIVLSVLSYAVYIRGAGAYLVFVSLGPRR
jgi:hypothetical protein